MIKDSLPTDLREAVGALADLGLYGSETTETWEALRERLLRSRAP